MITIYYGLPASGKSRGMKSYVVKKASAGEKILWLTSLRSERKRTAFEFIAAGLDNVYELRSKEELCPRVRSLPIKSTLVGIAACMTCSYESCPFKDAMREAIRGSEGVFVATHAFIGLAPFFDIVVVDEFEDAMIRLGTSFTREEIESELKAIEKIFGREVAEEVRRKYIIEDINGLYRVRHRFYLLPFFYDRYLYGITATSPPPSTDLFARMLDFVNLEEMVLNEIEMGWRISAMEIPPPPRDDRFIVTTRKSYEYNYIAYTDRNRSLHLVDELRKRGSVTIVARSKKEAKWFWKFLQKKMNITPLVEGINWTLKNFGAWRVRRVRVIIVRGKFYRSLDIESDYVIAFYQHLPPSAIDYLVRRYSWFAELGWEFVKFEQARAHIQTIYRCAREWNKSHEFYLLDYSYADALSYFPHIWKAVKDRVEIRALW